MSELHKFLFDGLPVRGMLVRLTDAWQEIQQRREAAGGFPPAVWQLLGEMTAASVLMQANIKFNGSLILQIFGDGPVKLAVAEAQPDLSVRATAKVVGPVQLTDELPALVNVHGKGRCAITLDPKERLPGQTPYQGVVPLHGDRHEPLQRIEQVLEHYMLQSEQLDTKLVLAANDKVAAGLLIQRLPVTGEGNLSGQSGSTANEDEIGRNEDYNRIVHLASTLSGEELLMLDPQTILHRLFWEEKLLVFPPAEGATGPRFACTCSRERVAGMLRSLGREEVDSIITDLGEAEVACDFCGQAYRFDAVDAADVFTPGADHPPASERLQ
ncbi:MAG: Hsp33 family molecular chaperone HslO [Aquabacterium sp.]|jgi:molecular chaperone Hsp33|nr:MAG: Hsp33 family molecular chaperone HslO [Aquabacterium sp.]